MAESLQVWDVVHSPWDFIGTIVRTGGKDGKITCKSQRREQLLRRLAILKMDPMDYLTGWSTVPSPAGRTVRPQARRKVRKSFQAVDLTIRALEPTSVPYRCVPAGRRFPRGPQPRTSAQSPSRIGTEVPSAVTSDNGTGLEPS
jgi:hypothetical protein